MTRAKVLTLLPASAASAACLVALAGLVGCPSTATTSLYTPITGFVIDSQTLTTGLGCGTQPGQVYKYAAVVTMPDKTLVSGVFDCFTNGQFSNLPTPDGGTTDYPVAVYAYDEAAFPPELAPCADLPADAACPGDDPMLVAMYAKQATWTANCTGTQVQGMSQVAVCSALSATGVVVGDAGVLDAGSTDGGPDAAQPSIVVDTLGFVGAEGGALRCSVDFDRVTATFQTGTQTGAAAPVACPAPVVISPLVAGATYAITATLLLGDAAVATASCQASATADAGAPVVATCGPASP